MTFQDVEGATGSDEACQHRSPCRQVWKPGKDTPRSEDDIEPGIERIWKPVDIRADEAGSNPNLNRKRPRQFDGRCREVDARNCCPEPRPRERVQAEVALQMEEGPALYVPDLVPGYRVHGDLPCSEGVEIVER